MNILFSSSRLLLKIWFVYSLLSLLHLSCALVFPWPTTTFVPSPASGDIKSKVWQRGEWLLRTKEHRPAEKEREWPSQPRADINLPRDGAKFFPCVYTPTTLCGAKHAESAGTHSKRRVCTNALRLTFPEYVLTPVCNRPFLGVLHLATFTQTPCTYLYYDKWTCVKLHLLCQRNCFQTRLLTGNQSKWKLLRKEFHEICAGSWSGVYTYKFSHPSTKRAV